MITDLQTKRSLFKRYHREKTFLRVFTYEMAAKINWHRYGTKLRHCRPMHSWTRRVDGACCGRPRQVVVIVTDGRSDDPTQTIIQANFMKLSDIKIVCVGIVERGDEGYRELQQIASDPEEVVRLQSDTFADLYLNLLPLLAAACPPPPPPGLSYFRPLPVFTARCYACAVLAMGLCLCLSVTSRSSTKTAKRRITQTKPHDSSGILVFSCQKSPRNSTGVIPYESARVT